MADDNEFEANANGDEDTEARSRTEPLLDKQRVAPADRDNTVLNDLAHAYGDGVITLGSACLALRAHADRIDLRDARDHLRFQHERLNGGSDSSWTDWGADFDREFARELAAVVAVPPGEARVRLGLPETPSDRAAARHDRSVAEGVEKKRIARDVEQLFRAEQLVAEGAVSEDESSWSRSRETAGLVWDGDDSPLEPTMLARTDGVCLVYPGMTHSFYGESESAKSFLAQYLCAQVLAGGGRAAYLDFESDERSVVRRMKDLGVTREQYVERMLYLNPKSDPSVRAIDRLAWRELLGEQWDVVVVDGMTFALSAYGLESNSADDVALLFAKLVDPLARTGAAVSNIDHTNKNGATESRGAAGSRVKRDALTGAGYKLEVVEPLGVGRRGVIDVRVGKDRPGYVRGASGPVRASDMTQSAALVVFDSTGDSLSVAVMPPDMGDDELDAANAALVEDGLTQAAVAFVRGNPGCSKTQAARSLNARRADALGVVDKVLSEGYIVDDGAGTRYSKLRVNGAKPCPGLAVLRSDGRPQRD